MVGSASLLNAKRLLRNEQWRKPYWYLKGLFRESLYFLFFFSTCGINKIKISWNLIQKPVRFYKGKYVRCWPFCLITLSSAAICALWIRELSPQQRSSKERWQQFGSGDTNELNGSILWYRFDIELQKSRRRFRFLSPDNPLTTTNNPISFHPLSPAFSESLKNCLI